MNKTRIAKGVTTFVVSSGVDHVITEIIKNNVTTKNNYEKVAVFCGRVGIYLAVADAVKIATDSRIDRIVAWTSKAKGPV